MTSQSPSVEENVKRKTVAIVAMGGSNSAFFAEAAKRGGKMPYDEIWCINAMGGILKHDRLFHMDDIRIQERRAENNGSIKGMLNWMKNSDKPIVTSRAHPDYPSTEDFPLEEVIKCIGLPYFNSTAAYAIAYAIYIGVEKMAIYGCDFTYPDAHIAESGRGCVEFLMGIAGSRGIEVAVPENTTLLDKCMSDLPIYGYDTEDVKLTEEGKIIRDPLPEKQWPTAVEMEKRYDHKPKYQEQNK